jgi:hypothetical protein
MNASNKKAVVRRMPTEEPAEPIEDREDRERKKKEKWQYRLEKIKLLTAKALAVAKKRKWLVLLIGVGIAAYSIISSGGFGGMGGIIDKLKGLFN